MGFQPVKPGFEVAHGEKKAAASRIIKWRKATGCEAFGNFIPAAGSTLSILVEKTENTAPFAETLEIGDGFNKLVLHPIVSRTTGIHLAFNFAGVHRFQKKTASETGIAPPFANEDNPANATHLKSAATVPVSFKLLLS